MKITKDMNEKEIKLIIVNKAIQKILRKNLWKEAKELVKLSSDDNLEELISLYNDDNRNIFCLALDAIKYHLVQSGTLIDSEFPNFGINMDENL